MTDPEPPASGGIDAAKTVTLSEKDVRDAARLFRLISDGTSWASLAGSEHELPGELTGDPSPREELVDRARALLQMRRLRARHFNRVMFSEPAWDILLLLYLSDSFEGRQTISHLAEMVETPLTTVLRWVAYLEKERLVERIDHPTDRRVTFIQLSDKGRKSLDEFLEVMPR